VSKNVAIVIPTLNAGEGWSATLSAIEMQVLRFHRRLVIDSASTDCTVNLAVDSGFEIRRIERAEFNHGGTRQWAVDYLDDCEVIIFLTQDALFASSDAAAELVKCFDDPRVALAYGRQLPRPGAGPIEAHARIFNYGAMSQLKDDRAMGTLGSKVFFCSNSFSAYRRSTLLELGGFRRDLILGEDAEYAARAILAGYVNAYCAEAVVYHSHDYEVGQVFARYFDTGVFHARNKWLEERFGSHGGEGVKFVVSELGYLFKAAPLQIPRSLLHNAAKMIGYRLGRMESKLPLGLKRRLSMSRSYWPQTRPHQ
jgi:rhamnosyltransferase